MLTNVLRGKPYTIGSGMLGSSIRLQFTANRGCIYCRQNGLGASRSGSFLSSPISLRGRTAWARFRGALRLMLRENKTPRGPRGLLYVKLVAGLAPRRVSA